MEAWLGDCWPDIRQSANHFTWALLWIMRTVLLVALAPVVVLIGALEVLEWVIDHLTALVDLGLEYLG